MSSLKHKRVLLGITGGIAAYKSCEIVRRLSKEGADVRVVMTQGAQAFITSLTLQALSGKPVHTELLDTEAEAAMGHIELAKWADVILIAPASADSIAHFASGLADDLLSTLILASDCPKAIAPAMNQSMYLDQSTQDNIDKLAARGYLVFGPAAGEQACGDVGPGRMLEPDQICDLLAEQFQTGALLGKKVVITAGPTREPIDPVRFISNHSSGKMGYAVAQAAIDAGADVTLISGPVTITPPDKAHLIKVESAQDMLNACLNEAAGADIFIGSAAVADYRIKLVAEQKIKKSDDEIQLSMVKNPDIIATVSEAYSELFMVGFAAETEKLLQHAQAKLERKGLNLIVANDVSNSAIGFNSDNNAASIISKENIHDIEICSKQKLAAELIDIIATELST